MHCILKDHNMEWQSGLNNEDHVRIGTTMLDEMLQQVVKHCHSNIYLVINEDHVLPLLNSFIAAETCSCGATV
jgi:hypothetical protein